MKRIITHNGIFHADEVLAIALIHETIAVIPVERTRNISTEDINDPETWVIDVGGVLDDVVNNYDHHQDADLPASCMLVLSQLYKRNIISYELFNELVDDFSHVSLIDTKGPTSETGFSFNSFIKSFNSFDNGFELALDVARKYVRSRIITADKTVESRTIWDKGEKISMFIRVCDAFPIHWKRYEEQQFLIYPHENKWNLLSINSEDFPLYSTGDEEFMHKNRFLAVFKDKQDAINCAQLAAYNAFG